MGKIAVTGGTGFIGKHYIDTLPPENTVIISRTNGHNINDVQNLTQAFQGCDTVVHSAGINREKGNQTYLNIHVRGTQNVIDAAKAAGVNKIIYLSFLKARPGTKSAYHQSKWKAEQKIRNSGLDYTILKPGIVYGKGDHLITHIVNTANTIPLFATLGYKEPLIQPVAIEDLINIITAAAEGRLSRQTVPVVGAEQLPLSTAVKRITNVLGKPMLTFPAPVLFHNALAQLTEWTMKTPLLTKSQTCMLKESITGNGYNTTPLPADLQPAAMFDEEQIRRHLSYSFIC